MPPGVAVFGVCLPGAIALLVGGEGKTFSVVALTLATVGAVVTCYRWPALRVATHLLLLLVPFELFYRTLSGGGLSPAVVGSILNTTFREAIELLMGHAALTTALLAFCGVGIYALLCCLTAANPFSTRACVAIGSLAAIVVGAWLSSVAHAAGRAGLHADDIKERVRDLFPTDVAISMAVVIAGQIRVERDAARRARFNFPDVRDSAPGFHDGNPETYVIVLGEASRRRNWSLYGYERPTTPRLEQMRSQLYVFDNVTANATITIYSLPLLLTRATPQNFAVSLRERSIITLLRQGGYSVRWISNQERFGRNENATSGFALEANSASFAGPEISARYGGPFDSNLIARLRERLQASDAAAGRSVLILHMLGSHFAYSERYPPAFNAFVGRPGPADKRSAAQRRIRDEYDNSLLFTDYVLTATIDEVAALRRVSAVLFFADHGERLFDEDFPNGAGHGFPSPSLFELEVPVIVWLSPEYRAAHPELARALAANTHAATDLHSVFETVVDLTGLSYSGRTAELSLFAPRRGTPSQLQVLTTAETAACFRVQHGGVASSPAGSSDGRTPLSDTLVAVGCTPTAVAGLAP